MKNILGSFYLILSLTIIMLLKLSCKKADERDDLHIQIVMDNVTSTNIGQLGFSVNYPVDHIVETTGIIISADSSSLNSSGEEVVAVVSDNNKFKAVVDLVLFPATHRYFYKIYTQDAAGYRRYSKIYRHDLASMIVQNPYIVKGPASYNTHSRSGFYDYDEGPYGEVDHSLSVMCTLNDVSLKNYKADLNGIALHLDTIIWGGKNEIRHRLIFDVPEDISLGKADLKLYHKNNLVSNVEVEVCSGGFLERYKPNFPQMNGNYASYDGEIYNFAGVNSDVRYLYKWTPSTNVLTKLTDPIANVLTSDGNAMQILNGIIYFMPHRVNKPGIRDPSEEYMFTYNISSGEWNKKMLYTGFNHLTELDVHDSFIYQEKIFWIAKTRGSLSSYQDVIMCYDPVSDTYDKFHTLQGEYFQPFSYKVTVLNGKVYILRSGVKTYTGSTTPTLANKFFEFDMSSKKLIPKSWVVDKAKRKWISMNSSLVGCVDPYLASFNGKIYAYGGKLEQSSSIRHHTFFVVYDPNTDKWSPVNNYSYYTAKVSQTSGFMLPVNGKLYLGNGIDGYFLRWGAGSTSGYSSPYVYTVSVE